MRKANELNNLAVKNSEVAAQWHPNKNGNLKPTDVLSGSDKKVWWVCSDGHEWVARVANRTVGNNGCPYCCGKLTSKTNNLLNLFPNIAVEWNMNRNGSLNPADVTPQSSKKVWWVCKKNHEWQAKVSGRVNGNGCPYCAGKLPTEDYNLAILFPDVAAEWDFEKNDVTFNPKNVMPKSSKKAWWLCSEGHSWESCVSDRTAGSGCPYCFGRFASKDYNLSYLFPEIAAEWHPTFNTLTPQDVTPHSDKRIWWLCPEGHEWESNVDNRTNGHGCPYCAGQLPTENYNLAILFPEIAVQWNKTKNGNLNPTDVMPKSHKKVWWMCEKNHEWEAAIGSRTGGCGCPYCSGYFPSEDYNFAYLFPELAMEWNTEKNGNLKATDFSPYSNKKVWWKCESGHEFKMVVSDRAQGSGCPYCSGRFASSDNNLLNSFPDIASELHPIKNGVVNIENILPHSNKIFWWICSKGHEWETSVNSRTGTNGHGCPYCAGNLPTADYNLALVFPEVAKWWHPTKNGTVKCEDMLPKSNQKVWWLCSKGHEYETAINNRVRSVDGGCPYCNNKLITDDNNLQKLFPNIAAQWHETKNGLLQPQNTAPGSDKKVWWRCEKDHEWEAHVYSRTAGCGCPYCSGRMATAENNLLCVFPEIATQWNEEKNGNLKPENFAPQSSKKVWWVCLNGHEWITSINARAKGNGCPYCSKVVSKVGTAWLDELGITKREKHIKANSKWYVVDGIDFEINTIFEFLGDFWHGNPRRFNASDINKVNKKTFGELFSKTLQKFENLYLGGYTILYRWESSPEIYTFNGILEF